MMMTTISRLSWVKIGPINSCRMKTLFKKRLIRRGMFRINLVNSSGRSKRLHPYQRKNGRPNLQFSNIRLRKKWAQSIIKSNKKWSKIAQRLRLKPQWRNRLFQIRQMWFLRHRRILSCLLHQNKDSRLWLPKPLASFLQYRQESLCHLLWHKVNWAFFVRTLLSSQRAKNHQLLSVF